VRSYVDNSGVTLTLENFHTPVTLHLRVGKSTICVFMYVNVFVVERTSKINTTLHTKTMRLLCSSSLMVDPSGTIRKYGLDKTATSLKEYLRWRKVRKL